MSISYKVNTYMTSFLATGNFKRLKFIGCCAVLVMSVIVVVLLVLLRRECDDGKVEAVSVLSQVAVALEAADKDALLKYVAISTTLQGRAADEQYRFISFALEGVVSEEGIRILEKEGTFGPLMRIFPDEGLRWASVAGVDPAVCVAFRLEHNGFTAEAAVATNGTPKVIRLSNIRRLADKTL